MKKKLFVIALAIVASAAGLLIEPWRSGAQETKFRRTQDAIPNQYIVVLATDTDQSLVSSTTESLAETYGGQVRYVYEYALKGFSVTMSEDAAISLSKDERVEFVEENGTASINTTQPNPTWGLDRIDQRFRPLSNSYTYDNRGTGVNAYIIDTGIRPTHAEFYPNRAVAAADYAPPEGCPDCGGGCSTLRPIICAASSKPEPEDVTTLNSDCNGHGTHVAGTVGGVNYGVAKNIRLFGIRVLNCSGSGTWDSVIAGVNWATAHHQQNPGPAVANMSLGGGAIASVDAAVRNSINSGITYAVAAGNGDGVNTGYDASGFSPARVSEALTVGATDINDRRANWSNFGSLVDVHAPGVNVTSAWNTSDTATNTISGTSMATPHVAGVAALYLETFRTASPATVHAAIVNNSTPNVISNMPGGTANRLLYSRFIPPPPRGTNFDFDGDLKADLAVWRPSTGAWHILYSSNGTSSGMQWGSGDLGDIIVPGDYEGDLKTDRAVWRRGTGIWYIVNSSDDQQRYISWGSFADVTVPADYDGDGKTDAAVWRPGDGIWYVLNSATGVPSYTNWGHGSFFDRPVPADYDGDRKADFAVWRPAEGRWYILNSSTGTMTVQQWGGASFNDVLVPSDYDGDGRADIAVWRPGDGVWYILQSSTGTPRYVTWGTSGDIPVPADYDGNGITDIAVWRPSTGVWYIMGAPSYPAWGTDGDIPIPMAYTR